MNNFETGQSHEKLKVQWKGALNPCGLSPPICGLGSIGKACYNSKIILSSMDKEKAPSFLEKSECSD